MYLISIRDEAAIMKLIQLNQASDFMLDAIAAPVVKVQRGSEEI